MLKSVEVADMERAPLYYDDKFCNAVVRCIVIEPSRKNELTVDREYEAFIPKSEAFAVVTNDKMSTVSYAITNFKVVQRINFKDKLLGLLRFTRKIY